MANNYQAVPIENFGGLDLRTDSEDSTPIRAISMKDVELDHIGRARMRSGVSKVVSVSGTTYLNMVGFRAASGGDPQVVVINAVNGALTAYNASTGASVATLTPTGAAGADSILGAVMIGTPTASQVMYLTTTSGTKLIKYDGSAFSETTLGGGARHAAVQYPDNRLVLANSGVATTKSRVVFSAPNDPETFNLSDDYIDLLPGDGEEIVGMANYRNDLLVFKQNSFFRFYGNSVDQTGGTIFNNTQVRHNLNTPYRVGGGLVASGDEGVYFLGQDGIYLTTGGNPVKVSAPIDPMFATYGRDGFFTDYEGMTTPVPKLTYVAGRLYVNWFHSDITSTSSGQMFVYDPKNNTWVYWRMWNGRGTVIWGMTGLSLNNTAKQIPYFLAVTAPSGTARSVIGRLDSASTYDVDHDVSVSVNATYRTNFMDLGEPASMKRVREIMVEGSVSVGTVSVSVNNQLTAYNAYSTVTTSLYSAGSSPTWPDVNIGQARMRKAVRGQNFSLMITGGNWLLSRMVAHVDSPRPAGVRLLT